MKYRDWELLEAMPEGWRIDNTAGSPLHGHVFVSDGRSILHGAKRALLRVLPKQGSLNLPPAVRPIPAPQISDAPRAEPDPCVPLALNSLARKQLMHRLLADIRVDLLVCEIEGWCKREYLEEIKLLINCIGQSPETSDGGSEG